MGYHNTSKAKSRNIFKQMVRLKTSELFYKRGQCEFCKKTDRRITWHHKIYVMPPKLKRKDLNELCEECHAKEEKRLDELRLKGNMLKRELR